MLPSHEYIDPVIEEVARRALLHVGAVAKSYADTAVDLTDAAGACVISGDRARLSRDMDAPELTLTVTVLRAVGEQAADFAAEFKARQDEAEQAFWAVRDELENELAADTAPWQYARRTGEVTIYAARPNGRDYCVAVGSRFAFRVLHLQPQS